MVGGVGQQVTVLVNRAPLGRHLGPQRRQRLLEAGATVDGQNRTGSTWIAISQTIEPSGLPFFEPGVPA
jgi:hypothetical protein